MAGVNTENYRRFEEFIANSGHTYVFDDETSVNGIGILLEVIRDMGLDPMHTDDLRKGLSELFGIELLNLPDLEHERCILAPNHVSDVDALILGLLHPQLRIVSKDGWANNRKLRQFLDLHYDVYGLDRVSLGSLRRLLADSVHYFNDSGEIRHFLVFSQGTISDFNRNGKERISPIAQKVSLKTGVPVVAVFLEQVSLEHPTRIVFDKPMRLGPKDDFRSLWLARQMAMQNSLRPPARRPNLSHKHANNNRPGDPFF